MACTGNTKDHCCYFNGEQCQYLGENLIPNRYWCCTLLMRYGSWENMYNSEEYKEIKRKAAKANLGNDFKCGEWPPKGQTCATCGNIGT